MLCMYIYIYIYIPAAAAGLALRGREEGRLRITTGMAGFRGKGAPIVMHSTSQCLKSGESGICFRTPPI